MATNSKDKQTSSDVQQSKEQRPTPKTAVITWFRCHEALQNPGLNHITSYQQANPNMAGNLKFFWQVGADYAYTLIKDEMAIIPIVNFASFTVKL